MSPTQKAYLESANLFRSFFEQSSDAYLILDGNLFVDCNQATVNMLGAHSKEEVLSTHPSQLSPEFQPDGRSSAEKADEMIAIALEKGSNRFEWMHRRVTGEDFPVEVLLTPITAGDHQLIHTVWRDIAERKQAALSLQESEERFRRFSDVTAEGLVFHEQGKIVDVNAALVRMFGYSNASELIGKNLLDFIAPEARATVVEQIQSGSTLPYEAAAVRKDGSIFPVEAAARQFQYHGQSIRFASIHDITARKQADQALRESQQFLRTVVDNLPQSIFWKDTQLNYLGCNRAFARNLGLVSANDIIGKTDWDLSSRDRADHYREDDTLVIKSEVPKYNIEEQQTRPDGSTAWLLTNKVPLRDATGNVMGVLGMFEDITKRKEAEQLLRQSEATLASALRVAQMGHWEYDIATNMFNFNDQYYSLHGTTAQEVGGYQVSVQKFAQEFVYAEDAAIVGRATQEAIETTDPNFQVQTEARILHTDGRPRWVTVWFRIEKDDQGRTIKLHGVSQDISERKLLEQQVQTAFERRGLQVQISTQVSQSIASSTNLEELYQRVVVQVKEQFGYYYAQLLRYDADQDAVALVTGYGEIGAKMLAAGHRMNMGEGLIGTAAATGETVLRPVLENDPDWHPNPLLPETKGEVAVPIKLGDNVLGVLDVQSSVAGALSTDDQLLLEGLCGQVATAIESTRLRQEMVERLDEINRLYQAMRQEGWQAYQQSDRLPEGFLFDRIGVVRLEEANPSQENFLDIPIVFPGGQVVGTLGVADDPRRPLSPEERELLGQISEQIALAMESARLFDQTQSALAQSERLFNASGRLTQTADLQELVKATVETLSIPSLDRAIIGSLDYSQGGELDSMTIIANWSRDSRLTATPVGTHYPKEALKAVSLFLNEAPLFFNDMLQDERVSEAMREIPRRLNYRSVAALPLYVGSRQDAVLLLEGEQPYTFTEEEKRLFSALAPQLATVLENRRQYERAQKQAERESMLNTISQKIQSATTVEAVLQIAARELGHALSAPLTIAQLGMKAQGNGN